MSELIFDYTRLKKRAKSVYGSIHEFAVAMGWSDQAMSKHWSCDTLFRQDDIIRAAELLDIPIEEIPMYFFRVA